MAILCGLRSSFENRARQAFDGRARISSCFVDGGDTQKLFAAELAAEHIKGRRNWARTITLCVAQLDNEGVQAMAVMMVPRLQVVTAPISLTMPASAAQNPGAAQAVRTVQLPFVPQAAQLQKSDSLLLPLSAPALIAPLASVAPAEASAPPWLGALAQAAASEALAGLSEPAGAQVQRGVALAPTVATGTLQRSDAAPARKDAVMSDVTHPPAPPPSVAPQATNKGASAQAPVATQAAQQGATTGIAGQSDALENALVSDWLREPVSSMARLQVPRQLAEWLVLLQRPQAPQLLLRVQEQLMMPMLSRRQLRIGGTLGCDIDASHETEGARAAPETDAVLGVTQMPQQRLEGFDLRQPMRLFYDLLSRRRHARQKLTRISGRS